MKSYMIIQRGTAINGLKYLELWERYKMEKFICSPQINMNRAIPVRLAEGVSEPDELDNVTVKGEWRGTIGEVDFHMFLWAESIETAE